MNDWIQITREAIQSRQRSAFVKDLAAIFHEVNAGNDASERIEAVEMEDALEAAQERANRLKDAADRSWASAVVGVVHDLRHQGWTLQFRKNHLWGERPLAGMTRDALRERLLVRRDEQLNKPSVRAFVRGMERWRLYRGQRTSVVSLMRDGRSLVADIEAGKPLVELIDPYVQFVAVDGICHLTGLRTQDIWRYFRHTWSSPYESTPGRSVQLIIRDRSVPFHPVIGIAALSSAAVRLGPRDRFIGWDTDQVVEHLLAGSRDEALRWAHKVLEGAIAEIYTVDLVRDQILPADQNAWTPETALACAQSAASAKAQHHRLMEAQEYKSSDDVRTEEACIARAELYLFRGKRALELSKLIPLLIELRTGLPDGASGRDLLGKIVRVARSKTVGTEIADLTVCGAVAPYSHLAGGKLVAMLATTPEVVAEYKRRYTGSPGIIASSMAGRPIGRPANLCYIGTTSLYGRRPNQYDRLGMPAQLAGGHAHETIKYEYVKDDVDSRTQGVGTFQFSSKTLKGLERFVSSQKGGWKANNLFGEGTSPKLRGLRDGLMALGLDADELLVHGIERCMYGVKLASNVDRYLLGMDQSPSWIFDPNDVSTTKVVAWWMTRWAQSRACRTDIQALVRQEGLAYPIRHRARVRLPERDEGQDSMF
ncbi:MAG: DUF4338 domain-containing protein [Alphaproteobacteria bacterium]|nr:MAG: DUF4338 domain-containing protein [Alphaproteobacteria bacterium]